MGLQTNVDEVSRNANVDNTTRQGNLYEGTDPPAVLKVEKPEDSPEELLGDPAPSSAGSATYDPGDHTVTDVKEWVTAHPDQRDAVLDAEEAGKNRSTLIQWLLNQEPVS